MLQSDVAENADIDRYRRKVIHDGRKLRIRGLDVTVRSKAANKRVQSHACMSYAERESLRQSQCDMAENADVDR